MKSGNKLFVSEQTNDKPISTRAGERKREKSQSVALCVFITFWVWSLFKKCLSIHASEKCFISVVFVLLVSQSEVWSKIRPFLLFNVLPVQTRPLQEGRKVFIPHIYTTVDWHFPLCIAACLKVGVKVMTWLGHEALTFWAVTTAHALIMISDFVLINTRKKVCIHNHKQIHVVRRIWSQGSFTGAQIPNEGKTPWDDMKEKPWGSQKETRPRLGPQEHAILNL